MLPSKAQFVARNYEWQSALKKSNRHKPPGSWLPYGLVSEQIGFLSQSFWNDYRRDKESDDIITKSGEWKRPRPSMLSKSTRISVPLYPGNYRARFLVHLFSTLRPAVRYVTYFPQQWKSLSLCYFGWRTAVGLNVSFHFILSCKPNWFLNPKIGL